jgi:MFS family permease
VHVRMDSLDYVLDPEFTASMSSTPTISNAEFVRKHESWNFLMCWGNGAVVSMGFAFFAVDTVMAGLVYQLTHSSVAVGIMTSVHGVGWLWPQVFVGNKIEPWPKKMPAYTSTMYLRALALFLLPVMLVLPIENHWITYALLLAVFAVYTTGCGICVVPFWDVLAKTIPRKRVPMLLAYRNAAGGILGFIAGSICSYVLAERSGMVYPWNYVLLLGIGGVLSTIAYWLFHLVREPEDERLVPKVPLSAFIKRGPIIYRRDKHFRRYFYYRCYWALGVMSQSLFVPYAIGILHTDVSIIGVFTAITMLVTAISSFLWGRFAVRYGTVMLLQASAAALGISTFAATAVALCLSFGVLDDFIRAHYLWVFTLMYAGSTAGIQGLNIAGSVYILVLAPPERRATYQSFMNTLIVPLLCTPMVGGFIAQHMEYSVSFGLSFLGCMFAMHVCGRMEDRVEGNYPDLGLDEHGSAATESGSA